MTFVRRSPAPFGDLVSLRHAMDRHGVFRLTLPRAEDVKPRQIKMSPTIDGQPTRDEQPEA